mgnify:CR=1 FL=1
MYRNRVTYEVKYVLDEEVPHEPIFKEKKLSQSSQVIEQSAISDEHTQQILIHGIVLALYDIAKCVRHQERDWHDWHLHGFVIKVP